MKVEDIKVGVRVCYKNDAKDSGTVVEYKGRVLYAERYAWVKWDSTGEILSANPMDLTLIEEHPAYNQSEQEAIMLLLNLGYTITKNTK